MKRTALIILVVILIVGIGHAELAVTFLDVGQADAAIVVCDGYVLMIDGGNISDSQFIYSYLINTAHLSRINCVIATHPHEDHIGGLAAALNACSIDELYSPCIEHNSKPFNSLIKYSQQQGISIKVPAYGESFQLGSALVTFVSVPLEEYKSINDQSIVVKVTYGKISFLFTGDAGVDSEYRMLQAGADLSATVLKVGHHGSVTSSSEDFISAVNPSYAIVSVGKDNDYGLPDEVVIRQLMRKRISVLRTDQHGQITFVSQDGQTLMVRTKKSNRMR